MSARVQLAELPPRSVALAVMLLCAVVAIVPGDDASGREPIARFDHRDRESCAYDGHHRELDREAQRRLDAFEAAIKNSAASAARARKERVTLGPLPRDELEPMLSPRAR